MPPLANLAVLHEKKGDLAGAEATFEKVLRLSPTHTISVVHLARLQRKRGDRAGATAGSTPCSPPAARATTRWSSAPTSGWRSAILNRPLPLLERAVRTFPDYSRGWGLLARAYAERGEAAKAAEAARKALKIDPKNPDARKVLGKAGGETS